MQPRGAEPWRALPWNSNTPRPHSPLPPKERGIYSAAGRCHLVPTPLASSSSSRRPRCEGSATLLSKFLLRSGCCGMNSALRCRSLASAPLGLEHPTPPFAAAAQGVRNLFRSGSMTSGVFSTGFHFSKPKTGGAKGLLFCSPNFYCVQDAAE